MKWKWNKFMYNRRFCQNRKNTLISLQYCANGVCLTVRFDSAQSLNCAEFFPNRLNTEAAGWLLTSTAETHFLFKFGSSFAFFILTLGPFSWTPPPPHSRTPHFHFILWKHDLVSVCGKPETPPPFSVPCCLYISGFDWLILLLLKTLVESLTTVDNCSTTVEFLKFGP